MLIREVCYTHWLFIHSEVWRDEKKKTFSEKMMRKIVVHGVRRRGWLLAVRDGKAKRAEEGKAPAQKVTRLLADLRRVLELASPCL